MEFGKINALALAPNDEEVIAGDQNGKLIVFDSADLSVKSVVDAHWGSISAVACRPDDGLVAALSMDRHVSLWKYSRGKLDFIDRISLRVDRIEPGGRPVQPLRSESQALGIHPRMNLIATRNCQGDLLYLEFDERMLRPVRSVQVNEMFDMVSCQFTGNGDQILTGTVRGNIALVENGKVIREWKLEDETVHWFERISETVFLIASDSRRVAELDLATFQLRAGEPFARDDFEHITRNSRTGSVYASSFDRKIYEIDPNGLCPKRVVAELPFKLRWVKVLTGLDGSLVVQCRNGALYRLCPETGKILAVARQTPFAIWTGVFDRSNRILFAGEAPEVASLTIDSSGHVVREKYAAIDPVDGLPYIKRLAKGKAVYAGRIDGAILRIENGNYEILFKSNSGIRDIVIDPEEAFLFFADEGGQAGRIDLSTGRLAAQWRSQKPLRSLALRPDGKYLAVSERIGDLVFLNADDLSEIYREKESRTAKRMKWFDSDNLLYNVASRVFVHDFSARKSRPLVPAIGNTVEDFCWDPEQRYLLTVNYTREVVLADFKTGTVLDRVLDDVDYSKGILWLGASEFARKWGASSFATFGRDGRVSVYSIFEERLVLRERFPLYANSDS